MLYFAWRYPLPGNTDKLLDLGTMSQYRADAFIGYVGGMAFLFWFYIVALLASRHVSVKRGIPVVFGCASALALAMAWMYPVSAVDIFLYSARSRLFTAYSANPREAYVKDFPNDAWRHFVSDEFAGRPEPYGPLWTLIAAPITGIANDEIAIALLGFKVLALLCLLAGGWVILRILLTTCPEQAVAGTLFYLWNPLVLWEAVGNGHNDVLMMLPLLLALLAWIKRQHSLVIPLLVVAALIKYVTVLLIPLVAVGLWRRTNNASERWIIGGMSVGLSFLVALAAWYPFYDISSIPASLAHQGTIVHRSLAALAVALLHKHYPTNAILHWTRLGGTALVLLTLAVQSWFMWRDPSRLPHAVFEVLYIFLLAATSYLNSWYLIWLVALAAVLPPGWPAWRMLGWTVGGMAGYAFFIFVEAWWKPGPSTIQIVGVLVILGPTLVLSLSELALWSIRSRSHDVVTASG